MKTTDYRYDAMMTAIRKWSWKKDFEIFSLSTYGNEPMRFGVNWSAIGTVDAEDTRAFIENLEEAADVAEFLTDLKITVEYVDNDPKLPSREDFDSAVNFMAFAFEEGAYRTVLESFLKTE